MVLKQQHQQQKSLRTMILAVMWQAEWNTVSNQLMQLTKTPCYQQDLWISLGHYKLKRVDAFSSHAMVRCHHILWSGWTWEKSWSESNLVITPGLWKSLAGPLWDVDTGKGILERVADMPWVTPTRQSLRTGSAHYVKPREAGFSETTKECDMCSLEPVGYSRL